MHDIVNAVIENYFLYNTYAILCYSAGAQSCSHWLITGCVIMLINSMWSESVDMCVHKCHSSKM